MAAYLKVKERFTAAASQVETFRRAMSQVEELLQKPNSRAIDANPAFPFGGQHHGPKQKDWPTAEQLTAALAEWSAAGKALLEAYEALPVELSREIRHPEFY